ncbi:MAG: hypothetical protein AAGF95_33910 [Chloroflexota bacterium]
METQATSSRFIQLADILDAAFHLYRRHLGLFFSLALICFLPFIAIVWLPLELGLLGMWGSFVMYGTFIVLYTIATGVFTCIITTALHQPDEILPTLRAKLPRILSLFFVLMVPILLVCVFVFLSIVEILGLVSIVSGLLTPEEPSLSVVSGRDLVIFLMIPAFLALLIPWMIVQWLYPRCIFIPQALLLENRSAWVSVRRSWELATYDTAYTRRAALLITGTTLVSPFVFFLPIGWPFLISLLQLEYTVVYVSISLLAQLWVVGCLPLRQSAYTLLYYDYLVRYEGEVEGLRVRG